MKKITMLIVMAALCLFISVSAQTRNQQTTISSASLASYKAKLVILDFWATSCSGCVQAFPKLELLQKEFAGQVQFVKITSEKKAKVIPFLQKIFKDQPSLIPVITDDTVYRKKYPHIYIPHYVWLDGSGKLIGTTTSDVVTAENINLVLKTGKLRAEQKVDLIPDKPLFLDTGLLNNHEVSHYSLLFKGSYPGLASTFSFFKNELGNQTRLTVSNRSLGEIYSIIVAKLFTLNGEFYNNKRQILKVKDAHQLIYDNQQFSNTNLFTYINYSTRISDNALYRNALCDLNKYSNYIGTIEKTRLKCLILTSTGDEKNSEILETKSEVDILVIRLENMPFIALPVINESGYSIKRKYSLNEHNGMASLRKELNTYGLKLVEGEREVNTFMLRDK